eukprot:6614021-Prymnesium_polylepis.1
MPHSRDVNAGRHVMHSLRARGAPQGERAEASAEWISCHSLGLRIELVPVRRQNRRHLSRVMRLTWGGCRAESVSRALSHTYKLLVTSVHGHASGGRRSRSTGLRAP